MSLCLATGIVFFPRRQRLCGLTVNLAPLTLELHWSQRLSCEVGHGKRIGEKQLEGGCFECKDNTELFLGKEREFFPKWDCSLENKVQFLIIFFSFQKKTFQILCEVYGTGLKGMFCGWLLNAN